MKELTPYINFQNNCRDAMNFYAKCMDSKVEFMTFADSKQSQSKETGNLIMHSSLTRDGKVILMASDCPPGMPFVKGTNISISIHCDSTNEVDKLFKSLSVNGDPMMPPEKAFWGDYFGMVVDSYGIHWLLNHRD